MPELSYKQQLFRDYLLRKLGFEPDAFLDKYSTALDLASSRAKHLGKQNKVWDTELEKYVPESKDPFKTYTEKSNYFYPDKFNIIDYLNAEIDIKKNRLYKEKENLFSHISATDISNFTYCPVSFSISKTFETEKSDSAIIGTALHERHKLIDYLRPYKVATTIFSNGAFVDGEIEQKQSFDDFVNNENRNFLDDIASSIILFYGHEDSEAKKKYFRSSIGNFIGQPDYIFKNEQKGEIFVVEEKFQFVPKDPFSYENSYYTPAEEEAIIKRRERNFFFENHIAQINSYIYGISEYDIRYGYLVYWKYEMDGLIPTIISCNVLKLERNEQSVHELRQTYLQVKAFLLNKKEDFNLVKRNPFKCANCVSNLLCGHKTGKFKNFTFPYSKNYLRLYYAAFPDELKVDENPLNSA